MMYWTTLTQKGQVTIPKEIRDRLGLKPRQKVSFELNREGVTIRQPKTPAQLSKLLNPKGIVWPGDHAVDEIIGQHFAKEYAKKQKRSRR